MFALYQIKNDQTRVFFKTPKLDWCILIKRGQLRKFTPLKMLIDAFGKDIEFLFQCPIPAANFSLERKLPDIILLPSGNYRGTVNSKLWSADSKVAILNISFLIQIEGIF